MNTSTRGKLVILSGPSGAGKSTIVRQLIQRCRLPLKLSISATTRCPRDGERHGVDYYFLTPEQFEAKRRAGEFLECCEVYGRGYWYGTPREEVTTSLAEGNWVILEIDVQGAQAVRAEFPDAVTLFLRPESLAELQRRLRGRGTESEETIRHRLEVARQELRQAGHYDHQIINRTVDQSVRDICQVLSNAEKT
jgi:guanylate kinase